MKPPLLLSLLLLLSSAPAIAPVAAPTQPPSPSPSPSSPAPLDPKQLQALQSLNIPIPKNPCSSPATACDAGSPLRRLTSLTLANCSGDAALSTAALRPLSSLTSLTLLNCPAVRLPPELAGNLRHFAASNSPRRLTGAWLSRLRNLTELSVSSVPVSASGPLAIVGNMRHLVSVTVSAANLTGSVPKRLNPRTTRVDFSRNRLRGRIPSSITALDGLDFLDLSENNISGPIPEDVGSLVSLKTLNLSGNSMSGAIPDSVSGIPRLTHLDLGSNELNGSIPRFLSRVKTLKTLNLENNNLGGVLPFNRSFIESLEVFKVGGNENLCYNQSVLSSRLRLGIAKCDKHGLPISPPREKEAVDDGIVDDDYGESSGGGEKGGRGPSRVVLGLAIGLSLIVVLIIFFVILVKCCR